MSADTNLVIGTAVLRDQLKGALVNHATLTSIDLSLNGLSADDEWVLLDVVKQNSKITSLAVDRLLDIDVEPVAAAPPELEPQFQIEPEANLENSTFVEPEVVDRYAVPEEANKVGADQLNKEEETEKELSVSGLQSAIREQCATNAAGTNAKGKKGKKGKKKR